jgi:WD40 repeat protein
MQHRMTPNSRVEVSVAAFSPDGGTVATGDSLGIVRLWNADTGVLLRAVDDKQGKGNVISICFSPSGEHIVAGLGPPEYGVVLWDVKGDGARWQASHRAPVRSVEVSPDGRFVLSASNDDTARFWDLESGRPVGRPIEHRGEVWVATFSPDGRTAVTGGYDAIAKLWSVPSGEPIGEPMRHEGILMSAVFSQDGQRLLTGSGDRAARLWDVATCLPLSPPILHNDFVRAVGMTPNGDMAITGRAWQLPAPLPDDPRLIDLWVKLATERTFAVGENIEWLDRAALAELEREFEASAGGPWIEWGR